MNLKSRKITWSILESCLVTNKDLASSLNSRLLNSSCNANKHIIKSILNWEILKQMWNEILKYKNFAKFLFAKRLKSIRRNVGVWGVFAVIDKEKLICKWDIWNDWDVFWYTVVMMRESGCFVVT